MSKHRNDPYWVHSDPEAAKAGNLCVLCARKDKQTRCDTHVCTDCAVGLIRSLDAIGRLANAAAAFITPGSSTGAGGSRSFESKPPLNVDALDPANSPVPAFDGEPNPQTLLEVLEGWERIIREMRDMAPYGVVTETQPASLSNVLTFLRRAVPWMVNEPEFDIDDFHEQTRRCLRAVKRWDVNRQSQGMMLPCPTLTDGGECGYRLTFTEATGTVTCRRCRVTRTTEQLVAVGMSTAEHEMWVDAEVVIARYGLSEKTLRKWVKAGHVKQSHGRYLLSDLERTISA